MRPAPVEGNSQRNCFFSCRCKISPNNSLILFMVQKKIFSTRIDVDCLKQLKHLAVDTDKSLGNLLEEAIKDIVKKYKEKTVT